MGGGGTTGSSKQTSTVRYAPYVEEHHTMFLERIDYHVLMNIHNSPHARLKPFTVDEGFLGVGYVLSEFPALFDMFGKFMAGLDIEVLADQMVYAAVNTEVISDLVSAEAAILNDHVDTKILPKFLTGMRDINAVLSSSFVMGKANIAESQTKAIEKYSGELRYRMLPIAHARWERHLAWNQSVISSYASIMQLFLAARLDNRSFNQNFKVRDTLWPFTILDFQRAALGALQGASNSMTSIEGGETSQLSGVVGGALSGAAAGSVVPGWGTAIGAVVGAAASFL